MGCKEGYSVIENFKKNFKVFNRIYSERNQNDYCSIQETILLRICQLKIVSNLLNKNILIEFESRNLFIVSQDQLNALLHLPYFH